MKSTILSWTHVYLILKYNDKELLMDDSCVPFKKFVWGVRLDEIECLLDIAYK